MKARVFGALLVALATQGFAAFVGFLTWRWLRHVQGAEAELFCVLALVSMAIVPELARRVGAWIFLPPVILIVWTCGVFVAPLLVAVLAIQRTVEFWRLWRAWRNRRLARVVCL
jgi:hypothetical protein